VDHTFSRIWSPYATSGTLDLQLHLASVRRHLWCVVDRAGIQPSSIVVDLGSGTGNLLLALIEQGLKCHAVLVDANSDMLRMAEPKIAAYEKFGGSAEAVNIDLNTPPNTWDLPSADRYVSVNSLYALQNPVSVLAGLASIALPGARLVVSTPQTSPSAVSVLEEHLDLTMPEAGHEREAERMRILKLLAPLMQTTSKILATPEFHFASLEEFEGWVAGSGWVLRDLGEVYGAPPQNWLGVLELPRQ
jgi:SAM-dependent methyltransferase